MLKYLSKHIIRTDHYYQICILFNFTKKKLFIWKRFFNQIRHINNFAENVFTNIQYYSEHKTVVIRKTKVVPISKIFLAYYHLKYYSVSLWLKYVWYWYQLAFTKVYFAFTFFLWYLYNLFILCSNIIIFQFIL